MRVAIGAAIGAAIVALWPTPGDEFQRDMKCLYAPTGEMVFIIHPAPMGTDVIGAVHISGTPYDRIVPRSDLRGCH